MVGAALLGGGVPARANCADEIAKLEKSTDKQDANAIAANSGGQKDAAARGGKAQEASKTGTPVTDLPKAKSGGGVAASAAAAGASNAGEGVMSAKVSLNDARNAQKRGDEKGCMDAVGKAKAEMKP